MNSLCNMQSVIGSVGRGSGGGLCHNFGQLPAEVFLLRGNRHSPKFRAYTILDSASNTFYHYNCFGSMHATFVPKLASVPSG